MSKSLLLALMVSFLLVGCFGKKETPVAPVVVTPSEPVVERPEFATDVDADEAFDQALGSIPADAAPQFEEIIDEGNADEMKEAAEGVKEALENEEDKANRAAAEARQVARKQLAESKTTSGLVFRDYSPELMTEVKGVRPAVIYFTADDCEKCTAWEANLRAKASEFEGKNVLIMLVDITKESDLATEMNITEPGWSMVLTGMGEYMGPRPTESLTVEDLGFIFL